MFNLKGKVAIVTGGAGVLGGAMAHGLAQAGAKVGVLSRTESKVRHRVDEIKSKGGEAIALPADVLNAESLKSSRNKVLNHWGRIDILINAAGGNMKGATIMPEESVFDLSMEDFSKVTDLNLKGTVLPSMVFGKMMAENKQGCIINISSMASQQAITRILGYSASKAAIDNFTRWLSIELALKHGDGVRVNAIAPGFFIADQNRSLLLNEDGSYTERAKSIIQNTPFKRFGKPEELVSTVLWLCSDESSFITGAVIPVDGGFSAFSGV